MRGVMKGLGGVWGAGAGMGAGEQGASGDDNQGIPAAVLGIVGVHSETRGEVGRLREKAGVAGGVGERWQQGKQSVIGGWRR